MLGIKNNTEHLKIKYIVTFLAVLILLVSMMWPSLLLNGYRRLFHRVQSGRGVGLTTRFHLVSRLRVGGVILLAPLYAFLTWSGTTLLFMYISR
jgi:hypothetical protein